MRLVCSLLGTACLAALGVVAVAAPAGALAQMGAITGVRGRRCHRCRPGGHLRLRLPGERLRPSHEPVGPDVTPYGATTAGDGSYEMEVGRRRLRLRSPLRPFLRRHEDEPVRGPVRRPRPTRLPERQRCRRSVSGHRCRRPPGARVLHLGHREAPRAGRPAQPMSASASTTPPATPSTAPRPPLTARTRSATSLPARTASTSTRPAGGPRRARTLPSTTTVRWRPAPPRQWTCTPM